MTTSKVIEHIVNNDLCIGCGVCVALCPNGALEIKKNSYGFLIAEQTGDCDSYGSCLKTCPFNPSPIDEVKTEDELSSIFIKNTSQVTKKIGKYIDILAGYSKEYRVSSSSGGIVTYIAVELLENKFVDYVISVQSIESYKSNYFQYSLSNSKEDLLLSSKTRYYPVTLADMLMKIKNMQGKFAVVGIPCFIKAIRLAQYSDKELNKKIIYTIGIICGGVKSEFFTEYLAEKAGVGIENIKNPEYRIKDFNSTAADYSFGCINQKNNKEEQIKMRLLGDMWGTGLFKANACERFSNCGIRHINSYIFEYEYS